MDGSESGEEPSFTEEEWDLIKDLVLEGQTRDTHDLGSWLDEKSLSPAARREVERLLRSAATCGDFLSQPATQEHFGITRDTPRQIGRYKVLEVLGVGGMGVVYAGLDESLNRRVAIKVLSAKTAEDPSSQKRLRWDAQAASALQHPNIVTVHEVGFDGHSDYVVMECIAGKTLGRLIPPEGFDTLTAVKIAIQITSGLAAAHKAGIVHRDLKPGNIMITDTGVVKLLDFGLAKGLEGSVPSEDAPTTIEGHFAGTVAYVSPEQAEGKAVDVRSDIFSFGSVLFEMITGRRAFQGDSTISVLADILHVNPVTASSLHVKLDGPMDELVQRCLRKDRARRFQSIDEVGVRLKEIEEGIEHPKPSAVVSDAPGERKGWGGLWLGAAIGAATIALLAAGLYIAGVGRTDRAGAGSLPVTRRVTYDVGRTEQASLSPDKKYVVYASDRSGNGTMEIFQHQVDDGNSHALTHGPWNDTEPVLAPNLLKFAYRSDRDGGCIMVMPLIGVGSERCLGPGGHDARFSPDSRTLAYWSGVVGGTMVTGSAKIFTTSVISIVPPARFHPEFSSAAYPVWSAKGDKVLFLGRYDTAGDPSGVVDWWVAPIGGGPAHRTHALDMIRKLKLKPAPNTYWYRPTVWLPSGRVLFSAGLVDTTNIWSIVVPEEGDARELPQKLTGGTNPELYPSAVETEGHLDLAYTAETPDMNIWLVPLNPRGGRNGDARKLISGYEPNAPSIDMDGAAVSFALRSREGQTVRLFDLKSGKDRLIDISNTITGARPVLSGNGKFVVYSDGKSGYIRKVPDGPKENICSLCGSPSHLNFDGTAALFDGRDDSDQAALWVRGQTKRPLISWAGAFVMRQTGARFSPDSKWVVFSGMRVGTVEPRHIWITPVTEKQQVESDLIQLTDGTAKEYEPHWSPDGRTIYYLSDREGPLSIWARHVDPATARPVGEAFEVFRFPGPNQSIESAAGYLGNIGLSVSRNSLVFSAVERRANIWLQNPSPDIH